MAMEEQHPLIEEQNLSGLSIEAKMITEPPLS
jgi:hypothetical protein